MGTERGHEDKTQIGNLYSLALSGFGASLCRGLQSRATRCSGSTKSRSAKICHANLAHSRELQSYGGGKRKELAYTKPRRTSGILILENSTKKFDLRNGCVTSSLARSPSISSSSSSESFEASNLVNKKKKDKQGSKLPTIVKHVGKQPVTVNRAGRVDDVKIIQTTHKPKYPCRLCKGNHFLKDCPGLSKVIEAWSAYPFQSTSSTSEQHVDDPPSTSQDTVGKKKSRVKFSCMLCKGSHLIHLCPHMGEASKLVEDMTVSQPQLPAAYHKLTLDPTIVDGMITLVPSPVNPVNHVVNLVTSLVEPVDKVVDPIPSSVNPTLPSENETKADDLIPSSVDPTLPLESITQVVDLFPPVEPILPLENETQVVDLVLSSVDPTDL
jgi:hypothetical protein